MKIFSIICTRDKNLSPTTKALVGILSSYGVEIKVLANQNSIFEAYEKGLELCNADPKDIIICCHDDIELKTDKAQFIAALSKCIEADAGFIGPAGTTNLGIDAVWWNHQRWEGGYHRGLVTHFNPDNKKTHGTHYGPHGQVVALDGLFLAARKEIWEKVGLQKPTYFEGDWDFYDIHYTTMAHQLGYKNYTVPIDMIHYSRGELVGRDSWHKNREAFIKVNTERFPIIC